jgi:hypothetical protein
MRSLASEDGTDRTRARPSKDTGRAPSKEVCHTGSETWARSRAAQSSQRCWASLIGRRRPPGEAAPRVAGGPGLRPRSLRGCLLVRGTSTTTSTPVENGTWGRRGQLTRRHTPRPGPAGLDRWKRSSPAPGGPRHRSTEACPGRKAQGAGSRGSSHRPRSGACEIRVLAGALWYKDRGVRPGCSPEGQPSTVLPAPRVCRVLRAAGRGTLPRARTPDGAPPPEVVPSPPVPWRCHGGGLP